MDGWLPFLTLAFITKLTNKYFVRAYQNFVHCASVESRTRNLQISTVNGELHAVEVDQKIPVWQRVDFAIDEWRKLRFSKAIGF